MATGCATQDTVSSRFSGLEENINSAKTAGAGVYAPAPLKSAEDKLEAARSAVKAEDMVSASRFVDEAMVDADYARAKAPTEKAKNDAIKLREAITTLRDEIRKMPAVNQPTI
jgi:DNA-binding PucR family transcriptional regulator